MNHEQAFLLYYTGPEAVTTVLCGLHDRIDFLENKVNGNGKDNAGKVRVCVVLTANSPHEAMEIVWIRQKVNH